MRIATYNVEWFANLFDDNGELQADATWSGRHDVTKQQQIEALGIVFTAIDADCVMVIEAPDGSRRRSTVHALENFAKFFGLRAQKVLIGFTNHTQQEIALLYDPDILSAEHVPMGEETGKKGSAGSPRFDSVFRLDLDIDASPDLVRFSKPPLEARVTTKSGESLFMIGAHLKSKAPHGAKNKKEIMRVSIENRRKQMAQSIWLRKRVDELLDQGENVIVLGDFNDGPGLDEYEKLFGRSSVEIVLGENGDQTLFDPHAEMALHSKIGAKPATSRFFLADRGRYFQALLDYIMISRSLMSNGPVWRIWHPYEDPGCLAVPELREALLTASDHFPVTLDFEIVP